MRRTSSISVSGVQVSGWSSITLLTSVLPMPPPLRTTDWMTSRKVSMPTRSPWSMTTSEPMSLSAIVVTAWASCWSGVMVYSVPPLTRRMSLTFMGAPRGPWTVQYSPQSPRATPRSPPTAFDEDTPPMPGFSDPGFDTLALHAGAAPDPATGARAVPIHLSTSFVFENSEHAASLFNLERAGHVYSRISNPTNAVLEQRVAALEGGIGAISTASGQAALHLSIATLMGAGSHIVASTALYGGPPNPLHYTLSRFGIETTFVKPGDIAGWRAAVRPNTKLFFCETVGNPGLDVLDIPTVSSIAHEAGVPLLVDSTLTSPWLIKPFEHGADLVYHSATKFLSGHGAVVGGIVVDGGSFDWDGPKSAGKFAELTQPYDGFHNMVFTEESTVGAFLLRARREGLRDFGACMSPHTAWLILQGIETLPLRMAQHMRNTEKVVEFLATQPFVARNSTTFSV